MMIIVISIMRLFSVIVVAILFVIARYSSAQVNITNVGTNRHNQSHIDAMRNRVRDNLFVPGSSNWTMARVAKSNSTQLLLAKLKSMHVQTNRQRMHQEPLPNNANVMEVLMIRRELETFSKTLNFIKSRNYTIRGFYHTSAWKKEWKKVIGEQLHLLDGKRRIPVNMDSSNLEYIWDYNNTWTSLLAASDSLYLNVAGKQVDDLKLIQDFVVSLNLNSVQKIQFNYNMTVDRETYALASKKRKKELLNATHLSEGEYTTITELQNYCKRETEAGRNAIVYYIHSKGGCCYKTNRSENNPVHMWRDEMNAMIIEFPSICTRALMKGYSTCGVENQDGHYSGNFWWADCQHVAHIGPLETRFDAWAVEFFVLKVAPDDVEINKRFGYQCGYSVHNCGLSLYIHECKRESYREKLFRYVSSKLGPNMVAKTVNDTRICREAKKIPYKTQKEYLKKHLLEKPLLHGGPKHRISHRSYFQFMLDCFNIHNWHPIIVMSLVSLLVICCIDIKLKRIN